MLKLIYYLVFFTVFASGIFLGFTGVYAAVRSTPPVVGSSCTYNNDSPYPAHGAAEWAVICSNPILRDSCPSDSAVADVYQCCTSVDKGKCDTSNVNNLKWFYRYPECNIECKDNTPISTNPNAESKCTNIRSSGTLPGQDVFIGNIYRDSEEVKIEFKLKDTTYDDISEILVDGNSFPIDYLIVQESLATIQFNVGSLYSRINLGYSAIGGFIDDQGPHLIPGDHIITIREKERNGNYCSFPLKVIEQKTDVELTDESHRFETAFDGCKLIARSATDSGGRQFNEGTDISIRGQNIPEYIYNYVSILESIVRIPVNSERYKIKIVPGKISFPDWGLGFTRGDLESEEGVLIQPPRFSKGTYTATLLVPPEGEPFDIRTNWREAPCIGSFEIASEGESGKENSESDPSGGAVLIPTTLCQYINQQTESGASQYGRCLTCVSGGNVWTAVGCIRTDLSGFVDSFFKIGLGVSGGIAFLFLVYGSFLIITSAGNPETIQHAREVITSAITGILLIIFAVLIIQIFAVNILRIPGFSNRDEGSGGGSRTVAPSVATLAPTATPIPTSTPRPCNQVGGTCVSSSCASLLSKQVSGTCDPGKVCCVIPTPTFTPTPSPTNTPTPILAPPDHSVGTIIELPKTNFRPNEKVTVVVKNAPNTHNTLITVADNQFNITDCQLFNGFRYPEVTISNRPNTTAIIYALSSYKTCDDIEARVNMLNVDSKTEASIQDEETITIVP